MAYKNNRCVKLVAIMLLLAFWSSLFGCTSNSNEEEQVDNGLGREVYVYCEKAIDLYVENAHTYIQNVIPYNDYYYVVVQCFPTDASDDKNYLFCLDSNGEKISEIELDHSMNIYGNADIVDDNLLYVTYNNNFERVNINTGDKVSSTKINNGSTLCGAVSCDDGYLLISVGRIDKYDNDDNLLATIENADWYFYNGHRNFYKSNDKYYLLADAGFEWKYYELDFENQVSRLVYDPTQGQNYLYDCSGMYLFDETGEYLLDIENSCMHPLAIWGDMNLQPPQYSNVEAEYIGIDTESFLQFYNYENGIAQLVFYNYEGTIDYSDRTYIKVGGFNCKADLSLNWAIYKYNTSQNEYRVIVEDYAVDFNWDSIEEAASQKAALIQYFNNGNTPDIFYGNEFDYDSFKSSGMILDISQYMSEDFSAKFNEITPNIRELMVDDSGSCYRIFSGYQINGYCSSLPIESDSSIDEISDYASEHQVTVISNETSSDLAWHALQFFKAEDIAAGDEDIQNVLSYSFENGISNTSGLWRTDFNRGSVNEYILWYESVFSVVSLDDLYNECGESLTFIGYPSVDGSYHTIDPFGQVAISSSTEYPQECSQFISYLLDDNVQDLHNLSCVIPVNDACMRKMVNYSSDHSAIPADDRAYIMYLDFFHDVSDLSVERYYSFIASIDSVSYYDWGVANIIYEEVESYYSQNKPVDLIAESLKSRLSVYYSEM